MSSWYPNLELLYSCGYTYKSENRVFKVLRGALVAMNGRLVRGPYILDSIVVGDLMNTTIKINETILWHKKL